MKKELLFKIFLSTMIIFSANTLNRVQAQDTVQPAVIQLEKPDYNGGVPIMKALRERKSNRDIADRPLSVRHLSELLWAANGQNREDGKRTAPSAMNRQMVDIYVVLKDAIYLFKPAEHQLVLKVAGDYRKLAGGQPFVQTAPVNLVYVADFGKWKTGGTQPAKEDLMTFAGIETGAQAQNVYLYGASEGLAVVIRGSVNRVEVTKLLGLTPDQSIVAAQTVGYPK